MKRNKIVLLIFLGVAVIVSLTHGIFISSRKNIPRQSKVELSVDRESPSGTRRGASKFTSWPRNPFVPKLKEAKVEVRIVLNGIVWDAHKPVAMINDKVLAAGESFNDKITVVQIKPDRVILNNGESDFELKLGQGASQP